MEALSWRPVHKSEMEDGRRIVVVAEVDSTKVVAMVVEEDVKREYKICGMR